MSNKKGITLVVLIITIIIMIILAGVSVLLLTSDEGIVKRANETVKLSEQKEIEEEFEKLKVYDNGNFINVLETLKKFRENFKNIEIKEPAEGKKEYEIAITGKHGKYSYKLDKFDIVRLVEALPGTAYAILTEDGTLYFTRSEDYLINEEDGKLYSKNENKEITKYKLKNIIKAFNVDENKEYNYLDKPDWLEYSAEVKSVKFDKIIRPVSTDSWFENMNICEYIDITNLDTSKVTNMILMFGKCGSLKEIKGLSKLNTSKVTNMDSLFYYCNSLKSLDLSNWNVSNVEDMGNMFAMGFKNNADTNSKLIECDLSNWNTSNVTKMDGMFLYCVSLKKIKGLENFNTEKVENMSSMFYNCRQLIEIKEIEEWDVSKVKQMSGIFMECHSLENIYLSKWDTSNVNNFSTMFKYCYNLSNIEGIENLNTSKTEHMQQMFHKCESLSKIGNLSKWDLSNAIDINGMFDGCASLTQIDGISGWDTQNVEDMHDIFAGCSSLKSLDLSNWNKDGNKVKSVDNMFFGCKALTEINGITDWDLSNINNNLSGRYGLQIGGLSQMFYDCQSLIKLDLSGWKTQNIQYMHYMFYKCIGLTEIKGISNWDISNVKNMVSMFENCKSLINIGDLSDWNMESVIGIEALFCGCEALINIGDLSNWKFPNVKDMNNMFHDCYSLTYIGELSNWDTSNIKNMKSMFSDCKKLVLNCLGWDVTLVTEYDHFNYRAPGVTSPNFGQ